MTDMATNLNNVSYISSPVIPSYSSFYEETQNSFSSILAQMADDVPGIDIQGVFYEDESSVDALGAVQQFTRDQSNAAQQFFSLTQYTRDIEKEVEKQF